MGARARQMFALHPVSHWSCPKSIDRFSEMQRCLSRDRDYDSRISCRTSTPEWAASTVTSKPLWPLAAWYPRLGVDLPASSVLHHLLHQQRRRQVSSSLAVPLFDGSASLYSI